MQMYSNWGEIAILWLTSVIPKTFLYQHGPLLLIPSLRKQFSGLDLSKDH